MRKIGNKVSTVHVNPTKQKERYRLEMGNDVYIASKSDLYFIANHIVDRLEELEGTC